MRTLFLNLSETGCKVCNQEITGPADAENALNAPIIDRKLPEPSGIISKFPGVWLLVIVGVAALALGLGGGFLLGRKKRNAGGTKEL